jgi:hypothetical protein
MQVFNVAFPAGNDISSSILYTLGLVSQRSGQLAPLCLLLVCGVLHFFRYVYSEVIFPCVSSTIPRARCISAFFA